MIVGVVVVVGGDREGRRCRTVRSQIDQIADAFDTNNESTCLRE